MRAVNIAKKHHKWIARTDTLWQHNVFDSGYTSKKTKCF